MQRCIIFFLLSLIGFSSKADVQLPAIFSDGMVLQQQAEVPIWGRSTAFREITLTVTWSSDKYRTEADSAGNWKIKFHTPKAGGPYKIDICSGTSVAIDSVFIGEVWLCSGQSNMDMPLKGYAKQPIKSADSIIVNAGKYPNIRFFKISRGVSLSPRFDCDAIWQTASSATVRSYSAVAWQFATQLSEQADVPIGIIQTSYGGTKVESWTDSTTLARAINLDSMYAAHPEWNALHNKSPFVVYNAMLHPIIGFGIKGVLWYQGEANRDNPFVYASRFSLMVQAWRKQWGQGNFPFYFVQIAPYRYEDDGISAYLREAQLQAADKIRLIIQEWW